MSSRGKRIWAGMVAVLTLGLVTSGLGSPVASAADGDPPFDTPGVPVITGTAKVGATLTADPGTWTPQPEEPFAYQWLRGGTAVDGAVAQTYLLTAADLSQTISVRVSASATGHYGEATSAPTAKVALGTLTATTPTIKGTLAVGSTVDAVATGWSTDALFYQWYADGRAISKATESRFKLTSYQHGKRISVKVTGKPDGYVPVSRTSSQTAKVMVAGYARVVGTAAVGTTLSSTRGTWTSRVTFSYRWLRGGVAISGATRSSYKLTGTDAGKQVSVQITGKRYGYATVVRTSPATAKVTSAVTPKISGSAVVGSTLDMNPGTWSDGTTLVYQWLRSGSTITGATEKAYKVASADEGKQLSVRVTGTQTGWATVVKTSAKTLKVMKAGTPSISGTTNPGYTLTARVGSWTSYTTFSYQWKRNGVPISGATRSTYKLTSWDAGKQVTVTVTGRKSGYTTVYKTTTAVTIGITANGWYQVGVKIQPGNYAAPGGAACYWERYDADPDYYDPVALMAPHSGPVRLTITSEDTWVYLENCGAWRPLAATGPQATTFGEGDFAVGVDIAPGVYTAPGGEYCFWRRADSARGELWDGSWWVDAEEGVNGVLALSYTYDGQRIVKISPSDKFFSSTDCGTWRPLGASDPRTSFSDGDYAVGVHLEPGIWETTTAELPDGDEPLCLVWAFSGLGGSDAEWLGQISGETATVTVPIYPEHSMITSIRCGTFTRVGDLPVAPAARGTTPATDLAGWDADADRAALQPARAPRQR